FLFTENFSRGCAGWSRPRAERCAPPALYRAVTRRPLRGLARPSMRLNYLGVDSLEARKTCRWGALRRLCGMRANQRAQRREGFVDQENPAALRVLATIAAGLADLSRCCVANGQIKDCG